ncbi:endosome/lysosome-associated apoptosis and autophagy regulator family member 2-like [Schistocerca cancellata]|uniref:endosome/lysosome-associated apoptosis and autophagy regulator family member 2-like n=1 Tax=Schistocerca cancellata TaxID=274614 RepID=UPI0021195F11|nr:endosome/lysosome-associated apoptosis and autophagy regulator family member 2-like [Schistocerca cancellata]
MPDVLRSASMSVLRSILFVFVTCCIFFAVGSIYEQDLEICKQPEYHFELTECDMEKGRWRVQVPTSGMCQDTLPSPATRINDCRISCDAGYYFDLGDLKCRMCRPGTFSLGGGVLFDQWNELPVGFFTQVESFRSSFTSNGRYNVEVNCSRFGWQPKGEFIASLGGPCAATLTYTVHLVKPGNMTYIYQYSDKDVIFDFEAQNDQCQSVGDSKEYRWPSSTREGEWKQQTIQLKTGQNVLQWKTIGMDIHHGKPVLIKSIEISGVAFTSSCTPCRAGTYSPSGARSCLECPENHYSTSEASTCTPCNNITEYAPRMSSSCLRRQPCTHKDYYETRTPCDANNQTQHVYQWLQPKICRDDVINAVQLPEPREKQACPPCNPGMEYVNGSTCEFCPKEMYSDGKTGCKRCPPNTTPNYGYQILHWTEMPKMMSAACIQPDGTRCSNGLGWQCAGSYIHSAHNQNYGAYLLLSLNVAGFRSQGGFSSDHHLEVGSISFSFELICRSKCEFVFMQGSDSKELSVIQRWTESQPRQDFVLALMQNDSYTFSWAFQKLPLDEDSNEEMLEDDIAKIYSINVTNTIDGGASTCLPCHQGTEDHGCIPCPPGHYIDPNTTACTHCRIGSTVTDPLAYGEESCQPCGPGLTSLDGVSCTTNCVFNIDGLQYDLRSLSNTYLVKGSRLFTASGAQYYHLFNISLCGHTKAQCSNNVSYQTEGQAAHVKSLICRTTIVPSQWAEEDLVLSTQSVTLGDELVGVTRSNTFMNVDFIYEFSDVGFQDGLHFYYSTPLATRSCPQGRKTVITLLCAPDEKGSGTITLPKKCPDGTCDGCNFSFLWSSAAACPVCTEKDYRMVKSECINGVQSVHFLPPSDCLMPLDMPLTRRVTCTAQIPLQLQVVIAVTIALALFLCGLMIYFWKKTQNLEYKYMKLKQSSGGRDGDGDNELAPAESCALDDGEEEEIQFTQPRSLGILNRIRSMKMIGGMGESGKSFETIQLTK